VGTISSGVGLISGLDYNSLIEQLIEVEAAPRDRLLERVGTIDAQRTAFLDISARISGLLSHIVSLTKPSFFNNNNVNSSNADILGATATSAAAQGSYSFIVRSLASTHQLVSRGFSSPETQLEPGELTIQSARARVNTHTRLDELNGYRGVFRGSFELTDGEGNDATISISNASTLADVIDRIDEAGINVTAEIRGDGLVLTETNGGTLRVNEVDGGTTAADLGFGPGSTYSSIGRIEGGDLIYLSEYTPLSALNDANGVRHARAGADFEINGVSVSLSDVLNDGTRLGRLNRGAGVELGRIRITLENNLGQNQEYDIDLTGLNTVGEIADALEGSVDGLTVTRSDNRLNISLAENGDDKFLKIEDLSGHAARDLGIEQESEIGKITGEGILHSDTLGAVVAALNYADGNDGAFTASIDGDRLVLDAGGALELSSVNSQTLRDLGFADGSYTGALSGQRVIGGLDSALLKTLNGGQGFEPGRINIQIGGGDLVLDVSGAETLREVVELINEASEIEGLGIEAGFDHTGTRLVIESLDGATPFSISDVEGTFAADIGLAQAEPGARLSSDNLQKQYLNEAALLSGLNNGRGVTLGSFQIKNSLGLYAAVDLSSGTVETLQDVIDRINSATLAGGAPAGVTARINDSGDGLLIEDSAGGDNNLEITDESGSAARDLNIAGTGVNDAIDGSYAIRIELSGAETLEDVAELINERNGAASAMILNDGTGITPYRLQITSGSIGLGGELLVDGMGFTNLTRAQDAEVVLGDNPDSGILITSSSNTIENIVPGVTLDLLAASDEAVAVSISRDIDSIVDTFSEFISGYNEVMDRIDELSDYDSETETSGILLGDGTLRSVERRLQQMIMANRSSPVGDLRRLSDFGAHFRNSKLEFNAEELREALGDDIDDVIEFFTNEDDGLAHEFKEKLEAITDTDGLLDRRGNTLETKKEQINDRIDVLNDRLDRRAETLLRQFLAMESSLAQMQSQQNALTQLSSLTSSTGTSSASG